jgi:hypothetical protein
MSHEPKRRFAFKRRAGTQRARTLSVSIYPHHLRILELCAIEYQLSPSVVVGLLLDTEQRDGIVRKELVRRSPCNLWTTQTEQAA